MINGDLKFYADNKRHLVCKPYSIENLHIMADRLNIPRHWFHKGSNLPHYDIPLNRKDEILSKCNIVRPREIVAIIRSIYPAVSK
jgi:hypothetical protein